VRVLRAHPRCVWRACPVTRVRCSSSAKLAKEHGVTTKAVRDIWNMRCA